MRGTFIQTETGEVFTDAELRTKEQREQYKMIQEKQREYELKHLQIDKNYKRYGTFVWFIYHSQQVIDLGITPDQLTKLIYLSTYLNYKNRLIIEKDKHMTRADMQEILKVKERTFKTFWSAVVKANILKADPDDDCLYIDDKMFKRGKVELDEDENKIRLYIKNIRNLYEQANPSEHKFLSYLFQAIPYINKNYNIISQNPLENELSLVKPMQMTEYCKIINYDPDNVRRLKAQMKALKINGKHVFSFVDNGDGLFCYVNPYVYYTGNKWEKVEILGKF